MEVATGFVNWLNFSKHFYCYILAGEIFERILNRQGKGAAPVEVPLSFSANLRVLI